MTAIENLVHQTTSGTGTVSLTLVAVNGKQGFDTAFGHGTTTDVFFYFISNRDASEWERGTGHMSDATTLVRDTVLQSSSSNLAVSFSTGTKDVCNDLPASAAYLLLSGAITPAQITADQTDYNPSGLATAGTLRLSTNASRTLKSLAGGADGRLLILVNTGVFRIVLQQDDATTGTAANRFLLPSGQNYTIAGGGAAMLKYDGTAGRWRVVDAPRGIGPFTVYLATTGSDSNDGRSAANAVLTPERACAIALELNGALGGVTIQVADGSYTGAFNLFGAVCGSTTYALLGNTTTPGNVVITNNAPVTVQDTCGLSIQGMRLVATSGGAGLFVRQFSICDYGNVEFGACGTHVSLDGLSKASMVNNCAIVGDAIVHCSAGNGSVIDLSSATITIASARTFTIFANATNSAIVGAPTFSGAGVAGTTGQTSYAADSRITPTNFPGSVAAGGTNSADADGSASNPFWTWASDLDTGIYRIGANNLGIAASGTKVLDITSTGVTVPNGSAATPPIRFGSSTTTGIFQSASGAMGVAAAGVEVLTVGTSLGPESAAKVYVNAPSGTHCLALKNQTSADGQGGIRFFDSAGLCGSIAINGAAHTVTYNTSSDERLKHKFDAAGVDWGAAIDGIWVGDFEMISKPDSVQFGIRAQQAERFFPQAILPPSSEGDIWTADYSKFAPLALWGVKDLRKRVAELEVMVSELVATLRTKG